jgi:hypothetical protein
VTPFATQIEPLLSVAAATVDERGQLVWANAGFRRVLEFETEVAEGTPVARYFIHPSFAALRDMAVSADGEVHRGLLTLGVYDGRTRSLRGRVWRDGMFLHVLAEFDIADLERLNETVLALNQDYAHAQLDLAQANVRLRQLNAQLVLHRDELQATLDRIKQLEGLLSICMHCKKIRVGEDNWQQVEHYVADHTDVVFSHGMCPECHEVQRDLFFKSRETIDK